MVFAKDDVMCFKLNAFGGASYNEFAHNLVKDASPPTNKAKLESIIHMKKCWQQAFLSDFWYSPAPWEYNACLLQLQFHVCFLSCLSVIHPIF